MIIGEFDRYHPEMGAYKIQFVGAGSAWVKLISHTINPVDTILTVTNGYNGEYCANKEFGTEDRQQLLEDLMSTKLQTPMEMIHTLWLLKDVSRAFTHQLVRYRVGTSFIQQSMRFLGSQSVYKVLVTHLGITVMQQYMEGAIGAIDKYVHLLSTGVKSEDARGILPTNILTNIFFSCSLRTLQNIFPQRLCCQAQQGEWQPILREMRLQIDDVMGPEIAELLKAPYEKNEPCGYRASFDRPCIWRQHDNSSSM